MSETKSQKNIASQNEIVPNLELLYPKKQLVLF